MSPMIGFSFVSLQNFKTFDLTIGNWSDSPGQTRDSRSGDTNGIGFAPYISISSTYEINPRMSLIPEVGYIIRRNIDHIKKDQYMIRTDISYLLIDRTNLLFGSSFMILHLSSDGEDVQTNDGNSTQTYYRPNEGRTAFNQTIDLGISYKIDNNLLTKFQTYTYSWHIEEERSTSLSFSLTYLWQIKELF